MRPSYGDFILEQERKERRKKRIVIGIIVTILLLIIAAVAAVFLMKRGFFPTVDTMGEVEETEQVVYYTQEELDQFVADAVQVAREEASAEALGAIKQHLADGMSAVEAFRAVYTDQIVVVSKGSYHFVPIQENIKKNDYSEENLSILENGEFQYMDGEQVTSHKGIDVSMYQGRIDWKKVAEDGVEFAILRAGYRGYGTGAMVDDEYFQRNAQGATAAGVKVGAYFFSQAITEEEVIEEANYLLEQVAPYQIECPIVLDVEYIAGYKGRMDELTKEERTNLVKVFCETIKDAGYKPMIYMNLEMSAVGLDLAELEDYDKWFAFYGEDMYFPYEYSVWQYSDKGTVAGIDGAVDMNIAFGPIWE